VRVQTYIDDTVFYGLTEQTVRSVQDRYVGCVSAAGLLVRPSKCVPPTCDGLECIGLEVDGRAHTVGLSSSKLDALIRDTLSAVRSRRVSGHALSRLVGRWSWAFLACRSAFAAFSAVYRFIECAGHALFTLWPSAARELRAAVGLAPVLFSTMCMPLCNRVIATDASSHGQGVCTALSSADEVHSLIAQTSEPWLFVPAVEPGFVITGEQSDLMTPFGTWNWGGPASVAPAFSPCLRDFVAAGRWRTEVSAPWRRPEHINALEMRAVHTAVRWVVSRPGSFGARVLLLTDSTAVLGALLKGRTSSRTLLARTRQVAAVTLAAGVRLSVRWVPSEANPADGPSRGL
jgi:hypothetical protein